MRESAKCSPDYPLCLVRCYEEEIINEGYFLAVAQRLPSTRHQQKLALLAAVERHAAAAVQGVLDRYGLVARDASVLRALGAADFDPDRAIDWEALMQQIVSEYPKYVESFRALEQVAPAGDRAALTHLTEHEVATIEFARRELAGVEDSLGVIRSYLDR